MERQIESIFVIYVKNNDYLYPEDYFIAVDLPQPVIEKLALAY
jgi:hypothetical protein